MIHAPSLDRTERGGEAPLGGDQGDQFGAFPTLQAEAQGPDTLLRGAMADQATLYGVLAQIEALGLELLEVRRMPTANRP